MRLKIIIALGGLSVLGGLLSLELLLAEDALRVDFWGFECRDAC